MQILRLILETKLRIQISSFQQERSFVLQNEKLKFLVD